MTLLVTVLKRPHREEARASARGSADGSASGPPQKQGTRNTDCTGHERMQRTHVAVERIHAYNRLGLQSTTAATARVGPTHEA